MVSQGDRRVEIETGLGMQSVLPDPIVKEIIDAQIIPQFKQENYEEGILAGSQAIVNQVRKADQLLPSPDDSRPWFTYIPIYIWIVGALGIIWTIITALWLIYKMNKKLTLIPNIYSRHKPKEDALYLPLYESRKILDEQAAFQYLKKYYQNLF